MKLNPKTLQEFLTAIITNQLMISIYIQGAPGIGKSAVVKYLAQKHNLLLKDVRLSQLSPTDLRGVPSVINGRTVFNPPVFLPSEKDLKGYAGFLLFFDELNMAPGVVQGICQQLILDRRIGDYVLPEKCFVWAAGNRKEDKASVFEMPAPLANRFLHLDVEIDSKSFLEWARRNGLHPDVLGFLNFRPQLIHKLDKQNYGWPSPRTWEMANQLYNANLPIEPAVGEAAAAEFSAYVRQHKNMPDLSKIIDGEGSPEFPKEPSVAYATLYALTDKITTEGMLIHPLQWVIREANAEWITFFIEIIKDKFDLSQIKGQLVMLIKENPEIAKLLQHLEKWERQHKSR